MTTTPDTRRVSRFIDAGGVRLHALDWGGDGPPLILVHGVRRTGRSWNAVARRLHDAYRVIALDTRGAGDSGSSAAGNDCHSRMRDIESVAEALELGPHFVMAHSLGGMGAGLYAAYHAERVCGVVLIEPVVDIHEWWAQGETSKSAWAATSRRADPRNGWPSLDDLKARIQRNNLTRNWTPEALNDVLQEETRMLPGGRVEFKWDPAVNLDEAWEDQASLLDEAARLTMPILILARDGNPGLDTQLKPLAAALPQGQITVLPHLGHAMYMEDPDLIADIARRFLAAT